MKMFINKYKQKMLAQYLALQSATNLRKSMKRSAKAVDSPHVNKERSFHVHLSAESFCIVFQKYCIFYDKASGSALFLIFDQISGSCFNNIVLLKKSVIVLSKGHFEV